MTIHAFIATSTPQSLTPNDPHAPPLPHNLSKKKTVDSVANTSDPPFPLLFVVLRALRAFVLNVVAHFRCVAAPSPSATSTASSTAGAFEWRWRWDCHPEAHRKHFAGAAALGSAGERR